MPSPDYFLHEDAGAKLSVYKKYAQDVAVMFGADPKLAEKDIEDMVNFEIELAKVSSKTWSLFDTGERIGWSH